VAVISTGDEVVDIRETPGPGRIRDINSYTLASLAAEAGALPMTYGIIGDDAGKLEETCRRALAETDMVLISGGSSVGTRDFTLDVLSRLDGTRILLHGISISPGKPTLLAACGNKPVWGLPGHVVSAMVVFRIVVLPFLKRLTGCRPSPDIRIPALLARNVASAQGRRDFVRVRLVREEGRLLAEPVLGKSGLIRTMVLADGLLEIQDNTEGVEKGTLVDIIPL
jgi:molybdopterin molybdotransferase